MNNIDIEHFHELEIKIDYVPVLKKHGEKCKELVMQNSPVRRGKYKAGWRTTEDRDYLGNTSVVVWNETDWQLTHLIENGHEIKNSKGGTGYGRTHANNHIQRSYKAVKNGFVRDMENIRLNIIAK